MKTTLARIVGRIALLLFATTASAEITLQLQPSFQDAEEYATIDIIVGNSGELGPLTAIAVTIGYDPAMIVPVDAAYGNYLDLGKLGSEQDPLDLPNEPPGLVHFIENSQESWTDLENAQPSSFSVATVTFRKVVPGTSRVMITYPYLTFGGDNDVTPLNVPATIHFEGVTPFLMILCPPDVIVPCLNAVPPPDFAGGVASDPFDPNPQVSHVGDEMHLGGDFSHILRTYRVSNATGSSEECTQRISILPWAFPGDSNEDCPVDRLWDLKTDWSDSSNPNGPWSYLFENAVAPGGTRGWDIFLSPPGPPHIWGLNDFYPGWSQSNGSEAVLDASGSLRDLQPGDIYAHSWNNGPVAVAWTSPVAGQIAVSGGIWPLRDIGRSNRFELTLNGSLRANGIVGSGDPFDREHPRIFAFSAAVQVGDVVLFSVLPYMTIDDFFGLNLRIEIAAPNAPTLACPPDLSVPCLNAVPPPDFAGGTVSDPSDPNPQVSHVGDETLALNPVQILRTYRAVNASGLARECTQTFTVAAGPGDLNADCLLDRADLDLLLTQIRQHSSDSRYDLNGDGKVDIADARYLILHFTAR